MSALKGHFDPHYHGFDTGYPDVKTRGAVHLGIEAV